MSTRAKLGRAASLYIYMYMLNQFLLLNTFKEKIFKFVLNMIDIFFNWVGIYK